MTRAFPILGVEVVALVVAWMLAPWGAVLAAAVGLFAGGWLTAQERDDRLVRRGIAARVGVVNGLALAATWWTFAPGDPEIAALSAPVRAGLAVGLGLGAGVAAFGLALIGLDARFVGR
ncbi:MAG: hypothetical protein H6737_25445 [Alphaproteobacteria bacterium]|nr:hypothetical protein [Alphaproteobacteria bacterium]